MCDEGECDILILRKVRTYKKRSTLQLSEGRTLQTKERRAMPMYVTYSDLIQIGIFIVTLMGLIYEILRGKNSRLLPPIVNG